MKEILDDSLEESPQPSLPAPIENISEFCTLSSHFERHRQPAVDEARRRLEKHQRQYPVSPIFSKFTYLEPIGWGNREVAVSRMLAWLLDASQQHLFDIGILQDFLKFVAPGQAVWSKASGDVTAEFWLSKDSRVDIYASGEVLDPLSNSAKTWQLALEAKIESDESEGQIRRYSELMHQRTFDLSYGIFLSPKGKPPEHFEPESENGKKYVVWRGMSYTQVASILLKHLIAQQDIRSDSHAMLSLFISCLLRDIQGYVIPLEKDAWSKNPYTTLKLLREIESDEG